MALPRPMTGAVRAVLALCTDVLLDSGNLGWVPLAQR